jgi:4-hydroxy-2-oxoheptanedioate aldolase
MVTGKFLREQWAAGNAALGLWAAVPSAFAAELMAIDGVSYVCVDQQHGVIDYADLVEMTRAIEGRGVVPITRVPANAAWLIGRALDAGAQGVVVPLINTAADAAAAVAACRYPPAGVRSFGPIRAALTMNARDPATLGGDVVCFVMVETREGLENIDAIAATPGLDGIYVGPADLALGLGMAPDLDKDEPEHVAAVERIRDACARNGIVAGIQCGSGRSARTYVERGFGLVTFGKDSSLLQSAVGRELALARGVTAVAAQGYT